MTSPTSPVKVAQTRTYLKEYESLGKDGFSKEPSWLHDLRKDAISTFSALGFPTERRGNEEWKYTDIGPIARDCFQLPSTHSRPSSKSLHSFTFGEKAWINVVFIDGALDRALSNIQASQNGLSILSLSEALAKSPELLEANLAQPCRYDANAFAALNTALFKDMAVVHLADKAVIDKPIHILHISTAKEAGSASYPRTLVIAGKHSKADLVESYWSLSDARSLTSAVTEIFLDTGSSLRYHKMESQCKAAYHVTNTSVVQKRDSNFSSFNLDIGGLLVRNNLNLLTAEEQTNAVINGLYLINGEQHVDNQVILDHAKPYTTSRELYKGVLGGKSRSVFHGSILVRPGAVKVFANQADKNLLLSPEAEADTKPAFWIYCDDVKCGHGAACGQMDEDALFYLRSRGMDEESARNLLTRGFVNEVINSICHEAIREHVDSLVMAKLAQIK